MMIVVVLFVMFIDRVVIKLGCMSLYKGKWKKISLNKPQNIIDILSLVYLVQKANANRKIIGAEIALYNIALLFSIGNTAQGLLYRYVVRFFVRLYRNFAGILSYVKKFLCKITENIQVDVQQSRQAVFVRCCL
jgi:hypothetical protein